MTSLQSKLKKIPEINFNANHWYQLIDLTAQDITKPPAMQYFSIQGIQYIIDNSVKQDIPDIPSYSLSVERTIKLFSEASHYIYGFDNQHSCIMTKLLSKKMCQVHTVTIKSIFTIIFCTITFKGKYLSHSLFVEFISIQILF